VGVHQAVAHGVSITVDGDFVMPAQGALERGALPNAAAADPQQNNTTSGNDEKHHRMDHSSIVVTMNAMGIFFPRGGRRLPS
jgi:hypothetical protein